MSQAAMIDDRAPFDVVALFIFTGVCAAASLLITATLTLISAFMPSWHGLLVVRALGGLALAGLPAIAMAYISEETDRKSVGLAMGLLIGGNAVGGMGGRLITGLLFAALLRS